MWEKLKTLAKKLIKEVLSKFIEQTEVLSKLIKKFIDNFMFIQSS